MIARPCFSPDKYKCCCTSMSLFSNLHSLPSFEPKVTKTQSMFDLQNAAHRDAMFFFSLFCQTPERVYECSTIVLFSRTLVHEWMISTIEWVSWARKNPLNESMGVRLWLGVGSTNTPCIFLLYPQYTCFFFLFLLVELHQCEASTIVRCEASCKLWVVADWLINLSYRTIRLYTVTTWVKSHDILVQQALPDGQVHLPLSWGLL